MTDESTKVLDELEWAEEVVTNPEKYTKEESQRAEQLLSQPSEMWEQTIADIDDILDIEDDDEREAAFDKWEAAQG